METKSTTLSVSGMSCGKCAARVEKALRGVPGVTNASVDLAQAVATVTSDGGTEAAALEAAVRDAGYVCQQK